jgi:DNA repair protein RecO (recombination protein O)
MATRAQRVPSQLEAYVLHHYDWSESSLILDLFTREQGRLAVAAKGAKRPHSQLRSVLLPFQRLHVALGRASSSEAAPPEVQTLRAAEWAGGPPMLTGAALFAGFYVNELLLKLLARHDPHEGLFDAYVTTLSVLGVAGEPLAQAALRAFELTLLRETGVLPDLRLVTLTQRPLIETSRYGLSPDTGVALSSDPATSMTATTLMQLQAALDDGSTGALQQSCLLALGELKAVLRAYLHYHLGSANLHTRQVMLDAQRLDSDR